MYRVRKQMSGRDTSRPYHSVVGYKILKFDNKVSILIINAPIPL